MTFYRKRKYKKAAPTTKQQEAKKRGKKAKANGLKAEAVVLKAGAYYTKNNIMMIFKREENLQKKVGCDFSIFLNKGKAGFLECKSRNSKSIPLDSVQEHQMAQLAEMERYGHIGAVVVRLCPSDEEQHWYFIPAKSWTHPTKKSLNMSDLEPYRIAGKDIGDDVILDLESCIKKYYP